MVKLDRSNNLYIQNTQIKECDNSKTLSEAFISNGDELILTYKNISSNQRKLNMLFSDNTMTPEAE